MFNKGVGSVNKLIKKWKGNCVYCHSTEIDEKFFVGEMLTKDLLVHTQSKTSDLRKKRKCNQHRLNTK